MMKHLHTTDSGDRPETSTYTRRRPDRGFSTVELAVSVALFLIFVGAVFLAVARALETSAAANTVRLARTTVSSELSKLSAVPYAQLAAAAFTVPDPCAGVPAGITGTSCVTTAGTELTISYAFQETDPSDGHLVCTAGLAQPPTAPAGFVGLCASVSAVNNDQDYLHNMMGSASQTQQVNAPNGSTSATVSQVHLHLSGNVAPLTGTTVYLVKVADAHQIVATADLDDTGQATFAVATTGSDDQMCSAAQRCLLALSPSVTPAIAGETALFGGAARPDGAFDVTPGQTLDISATVGTPGQVAFTLQASNGSTKAAPTVTGSVCLWATINTATGTTTLPACNTTDPATVTFNQVSAGALSFPIAAGSNVDITEDNPSSSCPTISGQLAYAPGTAASSGHPADWAPAAVCTSWTWGAPAALPSMIVASPVSDPAAATVLDWSADQTAALPAAGWADQPASLWSHPRAEQTCAADGNCTPTPAAPEVIDCPDAYCYAGLPPAP